MQLKPPHGNPRDTAARLALAVAALLGTQSPARAADGMEGTEGSGLSGPTRNRLEVAVLSYNESARVNVLEPVVRFSRDLGGERTVRLRLGYDAMSGASPSGAMPASHPQTFTSPSGHSYRVETGSQPRRSFRDTRFAVGLDYEQPLGQTLKASTGLNVSSETDYLATSASLSLAWDLDQRRTTLNLGGSLGLDKVSPNGGRPVPLSDYDHGPSLASATATKNMTDLMLGVTRILNERAVWQLNLGLGTDSGYLTEPYKGVSVVDGTTGAIRDAVHEGRPDSRFRTTVFTKLAWHPGRDVIHASYRWYHDDWGVTGHTVDLAWYLKLGDGRVLRPSLRSSSQTAADFMRFALIQGEPLADVVSADTRLARMHTLSAGLKYSLPVWEGTLHTKLEYMLQQVTVPGSQRPGVLGSLDVAPDLPVWMFSLGYDIPF